MITATQMLESMTENLIPTRAEVTDVANAILDGTDFVMLSAETAVGKYPGETVKMMNEIIKFTQPFLFSKRRSEAKRAGFTEEARINRENIIKERIRDE